jgi:hypothetical protein
MLTLPPPADSVIPPLQTTKAKYKTPMYPYLLPKSTSTANQLPFTLPGGQCTTVQVRFLILASCSPPCLQPGAPPTFPDMRAPQILPLLELGTTSYSPFL